MSNQPAGVSDFQCAKSVSIHELTQSSQEWWEVAPVSSHFTNGETKAQRGCDLHEPHKSSK